MHDDPFQQTAFPDPPSVFYRRWMPAALRGERDQLFLTYLGILSLANAAFATVAWSLGYTEGLALHLCGLLWNLVAASLRWRGHALPGLVRATQAVLLVQALGYPNPY